jgi:hypothetical protein
VRCECPLDHREKPPAQPHRECCNKAVELGVFASGMKLRMCQTCLDFWNEEDELVDYGQLNGEET